VEPDYVPLSVAELTVWNSEHPKPEMNEEAEVAVLREFVKDAEAQFAALTPTDQPTLEAFRWQIGGAWKSLIGREFPVEAKQTLLAAAEPIENHRARHGHFIHQSEIVPFRELMPIHDSGQTVLWVHGSGKSSISRGDRLIPAVAELMGSGVRLFAIDVFAQSRLQSDKTRASTSRAIENGRQAACFTLGYNHSLFAQSVHDVLTALSSIRQLVPAEERVHLVGLGAAGPWVACAAMLAGEAVDKIVVDTAGFRFAQITDIEDPALIPGAVKFGDVPTLLGLCAPRPLFVLGEGPVLPDLTRACYGAANSEGNFVASADETDASLAAVRWLTQ
jgi:pimeloyl-ACP methyl ester carboxylesterase